MMLKLDGADRAERIARMVTVVAARRADSEMYADWADPAVGRDYVTMLRGIEAWAEGPEWDRTVVARPRLRPDGDYWSHTCAEVLDRAADMVDTELGESFTFEHGEIQPIEGSHGARLVWTRKPNLERLFYPLAYGNAPMVAVDLDGRTYYLDWSQQRLAVYVANREPYRHGVSARVYAYNLLLLARSLGVDTYTVRCLTWLVVPGGCGIDAERNTALRILSDDEERAVNHERAMTRAGRAA